MSLDRENGCMRMYCLDELRNHEDVVELPEYILILIRRRD